ncbi:MAG: hypothetical protein K2G78_09555, partial [Muribaculaceae bacterium]|nr:hypothetical protein [Muribaculaceae bacterium]
PAGGVPRPEGYLRRRGAAAGACRGNHAHPYVRSRPAATDASADSRPDSKKPRRDAKAQRPAGA